MTHTLPIHVYYEDTDFFGNLYHADCSGDAGALQCVSEDLGEL